jgi:glycosyltransferase involved in cell wall biosynthesis
MNEERFAGAARRPGQPLLSVTIPTYNRARYLAELLETLLPQLAGVPADVAELVISDNASEDDTAAMIAGFQARGLPCRYVRNEVNRGSDANFLQCLNLARGQYAWVLGDDDLLMPNTIASLLSLLAEGEYDLVHLSSFGFGGEAGEQKFSGAQVRKDKLGRFAEVVTDGQHFLEKVNALIGLISVMLVNKNLLEVTPHPPIEQLCNTNLMQVGWLFPLVQRRMRVLYVWERLVAYRQFNSGGWGICEVFGVRLEKIARRYFEHEPQLARALMNGVLRYWMFDSIIQMRHGLHSTMNCENFAADIRHIFARNWRYWMFVYPVASWPLPLADAWYRVFSAANRLTRVVQGAWRHMFRHGRYLRPRNG